MKDKQIEELIQEELERQQNTIELIASENIVSKDYHPIKFVKSYDLNNLPDEKIFIAELTPNEEEE